MPQPCASCAHPQLREINHRLGEKRSYNDIVRWLEMDAPPKITRQALARHAERHLVGYTAPGPGRKPLSGDFLTAVVEDVHSGLVEGRLRTTIPDGIAAQKQLDARTAQMHDRDLLVRIALVLTGHSGGAPEIDPRIEAIEGEFRQLTAGSQ